MLTKLYCAVVARMKSEEGASAVEYGIMVALIAVVIIVAVSALGTNLRGVFNNVAGQLGSAANTSTP